MALTGRIGLVSGGTDFWAGIIRTVTRSPIHHCVIGIDDEWCVSAEPDMVRSVPNAHYANIKWLEPMGDAQQMRMVAWAAEHMINAPYNRAAFVLAGLNALNLVPSFFKQPLADLAEEPGYTCSMLVDVAHLSAGIDLFPGPSVYTWPGELATLKPPA